MQKKGSRFGLQTDKLWAFYICWFAIIDRSKILLIDRAWSIEKSPEQSNQSNFDFLNLQLVCSLNSDLQHFEHCLIWFHRLKNPYLDKFVFKICQLFWTFRPNIIDDQLFAKPSNELNGLKPISLNNKHLIELC